MYNNMILFDSIDVESMSKKLCNYILTSLKLQFQFFQAFDIQ